MKKLTTREGGSDPSSQGPETALPFPLDGPDGPAASQAHPPGPDAPKANGNGGDKPPDRKVAAANPVESDPSGLGAIIEAKRASRQGDDSKAFDPFDPARLRLSQDFAAAAGVRKRLVHVPVVKPMNEWFIRTHHEEAFRLRTALLELKTDREFYQVAQALWPELASEPTFTPRLLVLAVSRQGNPFLWPVRLPGPDGRLDPWNRSALEACEMARTEWVRVKPNPQIGAYDISVASFQAEPEWPDLPFDEILRIAFKDRRISDWDHPVLRRLRGEI